MPLKMRPTGLSSTFYKDDVDYSLFCGEWCTGRILRKAQQSRCGRAARPSLFD
jgi:hypothetical protein